MYNYQVEVGSIVLWMQGSGGPFLTLKFSLNKLSIDWGWVSASVYGS